MHQAGHHWPWTPFSDWSSLFLQVALLFCGQTSPYYLSLHCCQPEVHAPIWIYASETCAMCADWNRNINYQRQLRHENWSGVKKVRWIRQQKIQSNPHTYIHTYIYIYIYSTFKNTNLIYFFVAENTSHMTLLINFLTTSDKGNVSSFNS